MIARLVMELGRLARSGQPSLVKIDGLREHGKIYTVVLDGPENQLPAFRKNGGNLRELLDEAIVASPSEWSLPAEDEPLLRELADLFSREVELIRHGAFIALRMDMDNVSGVYQVSTGGPTFGEAYFHEGGSDLLGLMSAALKFQEGQ